MVEKRVANARATFLLDVDNTLLDNDRVVADFADHFDRLYPASFEVVNCLKK